MREPKLVKDFDIAVRDHAFRGAAHPGDREAIERNYQETKQKLINALLKAKEVKQ